MIKIQSRVFVTLIFISSLLERINSLVYLFICRIAPAFKVYVDLNLFFFLCIYSHMCIL